MVDRYRRGCWDETEPSPDAAVASLVVRSYAAAIAAWSRTSDRFASEHAESLYRELESHAAEDGPYDDGDDDGDDEVVRNRLKLLRPDKAVCNAILAAYARSPQRISI